VRRSGKTPLLRYEKQRDTTPEFLDYEDTQPDETERSISELLKKIERLSWKKYFLLQQGAFRK
jgi:hypothetical protein